MPPHILHTVWTILAVGGAVVAAVLARRIASRHGAPALASATGRPVAAVENGFPFAMRDRWRAFENGSSGNSAFDAWRTEEVARLEDECRRLEATHREFVAFVDGLRRARDREDFDRFRQQFSRKLASASRREPAANEPPLG